MNFIPRTSLLFIVMAGIVTAGAVRAEMPQASNLDELKRSGYVAMDQINTPLLYPVNTGKPYSAKVMLTEGRAAVPKELGGPLHDLAFPDEFKVHAALEQLQPFLDERSDALRRAKGYLVPLRASLGEYDFTRHRFPLKLALMVNKPKSSDSYQCSGAYDQIRNMRLTACIGASNWNDRNQAFQYLAIDNQDQAQLLKKKLQNNEAGFFFVMEPDGRFKPLTNEEFKFGNFFSQTVVSGVQPARVMGLLLVDFASGDILVSGPLSGIEGRGGNGDATSSSSSPAKGQPQLAAAANSQMGAPDSADVSSGSGQLAIDEAVPGAVPQEASNVTVGVPSDAATLRLDKLLAMLSFAVYSDPGKLAASQKAADGLQAKLERIQDDPGRDPLIKAREVKQLQDAVQVANLNTEQLQRQQEVKQAVADTYGARRIRLPDIEKLALAGHVYLEVYALPDGRQAVVFRGTDNSNDVMTDLQIGMTPELVAELAARIKSAKGQAMVTGMGQTVAGHFDAGKLGRPETFKVADELVRKMIRGGIAPARLILAGHSLGGGYAQYAGLRNRVGQIVAFNPAPLSGRLQQDAGIGSGPISSGIRHYVSFIALGKNPGGGFYDPVSQLTTEYLRQPEIAALRVIGQQYAVPVCADMRGPEYANFLRKLQDGVTKTTLSTVDKGFKKTKLVGKVIGAADGAVSAGTERRSAIENGAAVGQVPGRVAGTATYCLEHPYLCGGKLAIGGAVSTLARNEFAPRAWTLLSAHRMQNLEEAILADGTAACDDPMTRLR